MNGFKSLRTGDPCFAFVKALHVPGGDNNGGNGVTDDPLECTPIDAAIF